MLYFGDSSLFPESELNGSNIPGNPPSASSLEVTGSEYKRGRSAGILVLPGTPGLEFGAESQWLHKRAVCTVAVIFI